MSEEKETNKVCGHAASAKYMLSHFTEQLEQMNHQVIPAGFQIHLSAQTFCFLPHMCCALKQTCQKVCNVKSLFAQVC